jgi:hypothetical protein
MPGYVTFFVKARRTAQLFMIGLPGMEQKNHWIRVQGCQQGLEV